MFHVEQKAEEQRIAEILQDPRLHLDFNVIPESAVSLLLAYTRLWHKWNLRISLTAEKEPDLFIKNHLFISLQFLRGLGTSQGVVDIGSGGGLPGIPIKIMNPDLPLLMVECRRKRASFLMTVVRELGLKKTQVADRKVESLGPLTQPADTAVYRAVADTATCLGWARSVLTTGGKVILLRTSRELEKPEEKDVLIKGKEIIPVEDYQGNPLALVRYTI